MSFTYFKTQIKNIRKEALEIGFSISTMDGYQAIWDNYIKWKNTKDFTYDSDDYSKFLLEYYNFDINTYTSDSKSIHQQYMRSKKMLDDFDSYKKFMVKKMFSKNLYNDYPSEWNVTIDNFLTYCRDIKLNVENSIRLYRDYLTKELSYFYQKGLTELSNFSNSYINQYLIDTVKAGNISKRRNFKVLREFLRYLFIEDILTEDLSVCVPAISKAHKRKLPTYLKPEEIDNILDIMPKETPTQKRDYAIVLIAARLGLRISDILNIKLKDINWIDYKINIVQPKTKRLNVLPLSKEVGWTIIDYIKVRPKSDNEYLFIKPKYPFEKMQHFSSFNKYFDKANIEIDEDNKKGIHNLRHSLAKNMLDCDIPIETISSTLGHSSVDTTSSIYLKIDIKNLKKCTLEVDE